MTQASKLELNSGPLAGYSFSKNGITELRKDGTETKVPYDRIGSCLMACHGIDTPDLQDLNMGGLLITVSRLKQEARDRDWHKFDKADKKTWPKLHQNALVWADREVLTGCVKDIFKAYWGVGEDWYGLVVPQVMENVTHWMPMAPPQEDE